ncbi:hypothetical protein [Clostridium cylindrosporum]|uniref:Uncharacterized protein n=1 Tax=Clostridium cylindrosporum DSM 605 TaxID=1121307 RepID=A0A0J8D7J6_CLOCY|nr:hypothetical protein [Clostridium cylindrosporum]KMT21867.1 hypothetical protein CLCY_3c01380 [Clostridium cylindrosporum DSM 605]
MKGKTKILLTTIPIWLMSIGIYTYFSKYVEINLLNDIYFSTVLPILSVTMALNIIMLDSDYGSNINHFILLTLLVLYLVQRMELQEFNHEVYKNVFYLFKTFIFPLTGILFLSKIIYLKVKKPSNSSMH